MSAITAPPSAVTLPATQAFPRRLLRGMPLAVILIAQAALSVRLVNHLPAMDEARYIYSGHQLIYELWHGGGSPFYETYFSGNPDIYPPLAAMADHLGGIIAVRLMSTIFMLAVTVLLFAAAHRIFGYKAACASAGLFAVIGLTHSLGVYANYDALAFMLLSAGAYCAVRASEPGAAARWLLFIPLTLLAANLTKYMSILFDPIVIILATAEMSAWSRVVRRIAIVGAAALAALVLSFALAGTAFTQGLKYTTLARPQGANVVLGAAYATTGQLVAEGWHWVGVTVVLGAAAVLLALVRREGTARVLLLATLVVAGLLVTLEAIHLHSDESMRQHEDFGAWFCCLAAGYVLSTEPRRPLGRTLSGLAALTVAGIVAASGMYYSAHETIIDTFPTDPPVSEIRALGALIKPYLSLPTGRYLFSGGFAQLPYIVHQNIPWWNLNDDNYFKYPIPGRGGDPHGQTQGRVCVHPGSDCVYLEGPEAYRVAIRAHWFMLVSLYDRPFGLTQDKAIVQAVAHTPGYVLLTRLAGGPTWIYAPAYRRGNR